MATQFQTRLVGTVIVVAIGVIFFPEIFDGEKEKKEPLFASIPLQPEAHNRKAILPVDPSELVQKEKPAVEQKPKKPSTSQEKQSSQAQTTINQPLNSTADVSKSAKVEVELPKEPVGITTESKNQSISPTKQSSKTVKPVVEKNIKQEAKKATEAIVKKAASKNAEKNAEKKVTKQNKSSAVRFSDSAWVVQVASFKTASYALNLKRKLKLAGYQAHTEPKKPIDGQVTRVFVGPELSKQSLETQLPAINKVSESEGIILPFKALKPGG